MAPFFSRWSLLPALSLTLALTLFVGCGGSGSKEEADAKLPETPKQAATQIEQTFASAPAETQNAAQAAAEAIVAKEYEKAVVSLEVLRKQPASTPDQGMAVHGYMVQLEGQLIQAMEAGDPKARAAYELLKNLKRK